jgi:hypothetical protein
MGIITAVVLASICTTSDGKCDVKRVADFYDNRGAGATFCRIFAGSVNDEGGDAPGTRTILYCLPPGEADALLKSRK